MMSYNINMKQHITPEEWGEFERNHRKAAKKLRDYYGEWQRDYELKNYPNQWVTVQYETIFIWFNVGRMIEFLTPLRVTLLYDGTVMEENMCDVPWEEVKKDLLEEEK